MMGFLLNLSIIIKIVSYIDEIPLNDYTKQTRWCILNIPNFEQSWLVIWSPRRRDACEC